MARALKTVKEIDSVDAPDLYPIVGQPNLYLQVRCSPRTGATLKSWIFRFMHDRKAVWMGLGSLSDRPLASACKKAQECREQLADRVNPLAAREAAREALRAAERGAITFRACAERYIAIHRASWKNAKHAEQWTSTLETYAFDVLGDLPAASIQTSHVLEALEPIWTTKAETASRLRGRIESILDWATVRGYRDKDSLNPARWRGHLDKTLPKRSRIARIEHHAALHIDEVAEFVADLRKRQDGAARALEFTILTAARTAETIGATWSEVVGNVWTIPAERMKAKREHRVPLSARAMQILGERSKDAAFIFPGRKKGSSLSNMAMLKTLERMGRNDLTVHGFRSTFRDWASERTTYPREVVEMALAHAIGDKVEAAYRRGDLFDKRRSLMEAWAEFCEAKPAKASSPKPNRRHHGSKK